MSNTIKKSSALSTTTTTVKQTTISTTKSTTSTDKNTSTVKNNSASTSKIVVTASIGKTISVKYGFEATSTRNPTLTFASTSRIKAATQAPNTGFVFLPAAGASIAQWSMSGIAFVAYALIFLTLVTIVSCCCRNRGKSYDDENSAAPNAYRESNSPDQNAQGGIPAAPTGGNWGTGTDNTNYQTGTRTRGTTSRQASTIDAFAGVRTGSRPAAQKLF